jgi:multiple sugar transport system permease protein
VRRHANTAAALFIAPYGVFFVLFLAYPFAQGMWMSLHERDLLPAPSQIPVFVGFANFTRLFTDPGFRSALGHTFQFVLLSVPTITVVGLVLALALNRPTRLASWLRGIFFVSGVLSVAAVTLVWLVILNPSRGLLVPVLHWLGFTPTDVLADRRWAMPALAATTLWWSAGIPMALFLAGLQRIPREVLEAARLDHAGRFATFWHIIRPALRRTTWLVITLELILQFQVFGQVLLMTRGGPANSTLVLVQYIYYATFRDWQVGYAAAASMVLFALMAIASLAQWRTSGDES